MPNDQHLLITDRKSGLVAVIGRANVGKSTLVNRILGEKVSIVSPVAQTTRNVIRGVLSEPRGQLVFLDTPGVHQAQSDLGRIMNKMARKAVEGVDLALLVLDASAPPRLEDEGWMKRLAGGEAPVAVALNKTDLGGGAAAAYRACWDDLAAASPETPPADWFEISAATGDGVDRLVDALFEGMPAGPPLFPEDVLTDFPRKLAIADVIREKLFLVLDQELPHSIAIWVETVDETDEGWDVSAVVYVGKESHKGIVIGAKGRLLRRVRRNAERECAELFDVPIRIHLWVKVEKHWDRNFWLLQRLGYAPS